MNFLSVENLTKSFGDRIIFQDLTFGIEQGQKVALVAKNGNGKSTLLKCLIGQESFDSGRIVFRNDISLGYLEQAENLNDSNTIMQEVFDHDLPKLQVIKQYNKALKENDEEGMAALFEKVSELDAWDLEYKVEQILTQLKLTDFERKVATLSGGQRKRVALAKVLIAEPDFLILDEPTNHLDLDMIEWLETYLSQSRSTIFMVTHDRYFLEVVADIVLELEDQTLYRYKGNFSYYLEKKAEREAQQEATVGKARSHMRTELEWIRRQPKARGTKQKARIDAFHETKKVASQNIERDELEIGTKMERLGSKIVELHNLSKAYGDLTILEKFSYNFKRKERLGIVGPNGAGKSTFLKMIMQEEEPDKGKVVVGDTVVFGYYSQENIQISDDQKVIDVIRDVAEFIPLDKGKEMTAAQFLEKFLFHKSMHYNYVRKLSGGEKRRLKLMKVLMANPNFLILDEPTNDLDIFVLSVLEDYLKNFQGCLIVVSHDRYFMDKMVDHLFVFEGQGVVNDITGNYTVFRQLEKDKKFQAEEDQREVAKQAIKVEKAIEQQVPKSNESETRKLSFKEKMEFDTLEKDIEQLEARKIELTEVLSNPSSATEALIQAGKELSQLVEELDQKTERWIELSEWV
ncbi:MAG: ABC-F family ATP-binding cassette domain-containing protein [Crocinitomicaceae bacterium]|nr:ABC-F family ATP-binding cassette domain-containing protein [Crocinitomicaceae bacterium]